MTPFTSLRFSELKTEVGLPAPLGRPQRGPEAVQGDELAEKGVDLDRAARAVRELLIAIGEDPNREGLVDTPKRVARAFRELCGGLFEDPGVHLARRFRQETDELVLVTDIDFTSVCEHHLMPFTGRAHVAYLPQGGEVVGLSKLARTVQVFARRPQLQERLTAQIADALVLHLCPAGVLVVVEAEHACLRLRGAQAGSAAMTTTAHRGVLKTDSNLREEVHRLIASRRGARSSDGPLSTGQIN